MSGRFYPRRGKRIFDLAVAVPGLVLLSPILLCVALLVRVKLGGPVLFRQVRPGAGGNPFVVVKFRTMTDARDARGEPLPDDQRLTPFGRFLRSSSLDELPELFNVVRGEMSLVGPRPLLTQYLPYYTERERARFDLLPGITGWAQVRGRNDAPWNDRLADDVWYVEHCSLGLDLRILWLTVSKVLRRENVQVDPRATMLDLDQERRRTP